MKKDRDCGMQYMGAMPMMPMMPIPNQTPYQMNNYPMNYSNNQMSNQNVNNDFITQLSNLEKRVSVLEAAVNNNPYNNSNYQMM